MGATKVVSLKNAVAVIASDTWTAFKACAALAPEWALPTSRTDSQDVARRLETAQDADDSLIRKAGDGDAKVFRERLRESYARAPRRVEASYQLPYLAHATLEPMNATAWVTKEDVQVWAPTQAQTVVRREVATALNRPLSEVAVHTTLMGGGFGRRLKADFAVQAALVAQAVEGPVQLLWRREEDFGHDFYRPAGRVSYRAALATTGEIESLELIGATTDDVAFGGSGPSPYSIAAFAASQKQIATGVPVGAWRSVDACITVFAKESFIDECALAAGVDPLSYRLRLLGNNHRARRVLEAAASGIEWRRSRPEGHGIGLALFSGWGSIVAHAVEVEIEGESLRVQQIVVAGDCGTAINPAQVQTQWEGAALQALSVALGEEVTFTGGVADQTNFDSYRLLRMAQAPTVKVILVDSPDVPVGGVGEPGTPGLPAALANAIFAASGQRVRTLPLTSQGYRV